MLKGRVDKKDIIKKPTQTLSPLTLTCSSFSPVISKMI